MNGMKLNWSMMRRRWLSSLFTALLIAVSTVFLLLYPELIKSAEAELTQAYESIEVTGWLLNAGGYSDPLISPETCDAVLNTGSIKEYYAYSYMTFGTVKQALWMLKMEDPKLLDKSQEELMRVLRQKLRTAFPGYVNTLYGVNCADAEAALARIQNDITWLDGYSIDNFVGEETIVVFPVSSGYELGDEAELILRHVKGYKKSGSEVREIVNFKVAGLYDVNIAGTNVDINMTAYCPLSAMRKLLRASQWEFRIRSFSFTLQNNRELARFKDVLTELELDRSTSVRAAIDDRILQGTVAPIQKNVDLLTGLHAFLYALVALLGFFLCFLLSRARKPEYAVMRMLGESRLQVTGKALLEQAALCVVGVGLGIVTTLMVSGETKLSWAAAGLIAACYCAGAIIAVLITVRVDVMTILRDKE